MKNEITNEQIYKEMAERCERYIKEAHHELEKECATLREERDEACKRENDCRQIITTYVQEVAGLESEVAHLRENKRLCHACIDAVKQELAGSQAEVARLRETDNADLCFARFEVARLKDELAAVTDAVNSLHAYIQGERHDPAEVADLLNATTKGIK